MYTATYCSRCRRPLQAVEGDAVIERGSKGKQTKTGDQKTQTALQGRGKVRSSRAFVSWNLWCNGWRSSCFLWTLRIGRSGRCGDGMALFDTVDGSPPSVKKLSTGTPDQCRECSEISVVKTMPSSCFRFFQRPSGVPGRSSELLMPPFSDQPSCFPCQARGSISYHSIPVPVPAWRQLHKKTR